MSRWIEAFFPLLAYLREPEANNAIPTIWIACQLIFTVVAAVWLIKTVRKVTHRLQETLALLRQLEPDSLVEKYSEVSNKVAALPFVGSVWHRFEQTVHREPIRDGSVSIYRTVDSQLAFDEEALVGRPLHTRFINAVPGLLTSLGILGTFVGLTYGLAQIQGSFGTTSALKDGIQDLLKGASIAFSTSVWGIFLSVVFSIFEKRQLRGVRQALSQVQDLINASIPLRRGEAWLSDISRHAGDQTAELKRFNTDLAVSIAQALDEALSARITPAMEKLVSAVEGLKNYKEESSVGAIGQLVAEFTRSLSEGSNENIDKLNGTLSGVNTTLTRTLEASEENQQRLESSLERHLEDLSGKVGSVLSQLTENQQSLQEASNQGLETMLSQINQAVGSQQAAFGEVTSRMSSELQSQMEIISTTVASLAGSVGNETRQISEHAAARLSELAEIVERNVDSASSRFETESQQLQAMTSGITSLLDRLTDAGEGMAIAGEAMRDTATPIQQGTAELRGAVASLTSAQVTLSGTIEESERRTADHVERVRASTTVIQEALQTAQSSWTAYSDNFEGLGGQLSGVLTELTKNVADYNTVTREGITAYLRDFEGALEKAVGSIAGAIEALQDVAEDLSSSNNGSRNE